MLFRLRPTVKPLQKTPNTNLVHRMTLPRSLAFNCLVQNLLIHSWTSQKITLLKWQMEVDVRDDLKPGLEDSEACRAENIQEESKTQVHDSQRLVTQSVDDNINLPDRCRATSLYGIDNSSRQAATTQIKTNLQDSIFSKQLHI